MPESHGWDARVANALEQARAMEPGPPRNDAIKKAGLLCSAAHMKNYLSSTEASEIVPAMRLRVVSRT